MKQNDSKQKEHVDVGGRHAQRRAHDPVKGVDHLIDEFHQGKRAVREGAAESVSGQRIETEQQGDDDHRPAHHATRQVQQHHNDHRAEEQIRATTQALNSRLSGLKIAQVRAQIGDRLTGMSTAHAGLVRFFVDSADRLFRFTDHDELLIGGRAEVLAQPEFADPRSMRGIIELIENKDIVVHLLQNQATDEAVSISIGQENPDLRAKDLSVLTSTYRTATRTGKVGVIGPKRMDYSKLKSLVEFTARMIDRRLDSGTSLR